MEFKTEPWKHQREMCEWMKVRKEPYFALLWSMGTGKTKQGVENYRIACYKEQRQLNALIICPVVVMENWKREIEAHSHIPVTTIQIVDGTTKFDGKQLKNPSKALKEKQLQFPNKHIYIISTETVDNKKGSIWQLIKNLPFDFLLVDEVHKFKAYNGKRVKALHQFTHNRRLKYRYILTGSPVLQDACDLWSQFYLLNPNILGKNFFSFRARYFYDANAGMPSNVHFPNWKPKDEAYFKKFGYSEDQDINSLNKIIYQHAHRIMKEEALDLPPLTYQRKDVSFSKEQRRLYEDFERDMVVFLEGREQIGDKFKELEKQLRTITDADLVEALPTSMQADLAIVKLIRLQQLICGIFTDEEGEVTLIDTPRLKALKEDLESVHSVKGNKSIIWTIFTPTYEQIAQVCKELGLTYVFITGQQSRDEKLQAEDAFNNDPNVDVAIANQGAGGTGVNLTASNYSFYYSRSFKLSDDMQSEARNYRGGQTRPVTRTDYILAGTVDEDIYLKLQEKKKTAEDILKVSEITKAEIRKMFTKR